MGDNHIQLTTDGHKPYLKAVPKTFGDDIDYATLVKVFSANKEPMLDARVVSGNPDPLHINTSYVENTNLSMRMGMRRFIRRTNGLSKNLENHLHSVSLYFLYHNFCWEHGSLNRRTPAQVIGLTDKKYNVEWIVKLIDERAPKPNRPKTYKKSRTMAIKQRGRKIREVRARMDRVKARKGDSS